MMLLSGHSRARHRHASLLSAVVVALVVQLSSLHSVSSETLRGTNNNNNNDSHNHHHHRQLEDGELPECVDMIPNGDFSDGSMAGWKTHRTGGTLSLVQDSVNPEDNFALMHSRRVNRHDGPEHTLDAKCVQAGSKITVKAAMKLQREGVGIACDRDAKGESPDACPLLTLRSKLSSGHKEWTYAANTISDDWQADYWNELQFELYVEEDDDLAKATEIVMYIERLDPSIDMVLDHVVVSATVSTGNLESLGIPNTDVAVPIDIDGDPIGGSTAARDSMNNEFNNLDINCTHMIVNGNGEESDAKGWAPRLGGKIMLYPNGYADSGNALLHTGRTSFVMGPKHDLLPRCLVEGKRYQLEAQMKLLDEKGEPFYCEKDFRFVDDKACPLLTVQYKTEGGVQKWIYLERENQDVWVADSYNWYFAELTVTEEIKKAQEAFFYFERVKSGVSIVWDDMRMSRDCTELMVNGDAETRTPEGWRPSDGQGTVTVETMFPEDRKNNRTSSAYFIHKGRSTPNHGPRTNFDVHCLIPTRQYKLSMYIKLQYDDGRDFVCDVFADWGDKFCPLVSFGVVQEDNTFSVMNIRNSNTAQWVAGFNDYTGILTVSEKMASAYVVFFFIRGPPANVDILFDDVELKEYHPPKRSCDKLVWNGDGKHGVEDWSPYNGGYLRIYEGRDASSNSIAHYGRTSNVASLRQGINKDCLVEGKHYVFRAYVKLVVEATNEPYDCNKDATMGADDFCVVAGLFITMPDNTAPIHLLNKSPAPWNATEWNVYRTDFVVDVDLAMAGSAAIMIRGPKAGVVLIVDDLSIHEYVPPVRGCDDLVYNGDAEDLDHKSWIPYGGAIKLHDEGALGTSTAMIHFDRPSSTAGLKQGMDVSCLVENKRLLFTAHFKLLDEQNQPFKCDPDAEWGSRFYCVIIAISFIVGETRKIVYLQNDSPTQWDKNEFNFFSKTFVVPASLSIADEAFLHIRGPREGISIIADEVKFRTYTMNEQSCSQLVRNPLASRGDLLSWMSYMNGFYSFVQAPPSGDIAFKYSGRTRVNSGPRQNLDTTCIKTVGERFVVEGFFQLWDENDKPYVCTRSVGWNDPLYCIIMTIEMVTNKGQVKKRHIGSVFLGDWRADDYNPFKAGFHIDADLATARSAFFYFQGPRPGASIVYDRLSIRPLNDIKK